MKLKKLIPELVQGITEAGYEKNTREIQNLCISKIKSGADTFIIAPEGSGKSVAIVSAIIQQLKEAVEMAPRAIVIVESRDKAFELDSTFKLLGKYTNLRVFTVFDQGQIKFQKDTIYEGQDVVIGTPKRIHELLNITGMPITKVKMLVVEDAERILPGRYHTVIYSIADREKKIQCIFTAEKWQERFEKMAERIMINPSILRK